jgi:hypothetical protein
MTLTEFLPSDGMSFSIFSLNMDKGLLKRTMSIGANAILSRGSDQLLDPRTLGVDPRIPCCQLGT